MPTSINADGLLLKYGLSQAVVGTVGSPAQAGEYKVIEVLVDYRNMAAFGTTRMASISPDAFIPAGATIVSGEFIVTSAFTGATATLTIGLYAADSTTAVDATGIINATALSTINAIGKKVAAAGTSINATPLLATASQFSLLAGTATFTGGAGKLSVKYFVPRAAV